MVKNTLKEVSMLAMLSKSIQNLFQLKNQILVQENKFPDLNESIDNKNIDFLGSRAFQYARKHSKKVT